ncbi:gag/pol/env polyprotein, putative, partial [Perkinsus marinus ATCC 50983]
AKMWKNAQYNWHQNRKEAFALAGAYLFLNSVVAYVSPLTVRFWSDSHTAISWVTGGSKLTCESIERVAISRLIDAMADLRESWHRRYGLVPVTYHLAGKKNSSADELSRLSALWKVPTTLLQRDSMRQEDSIQQGGRPPIDKPSAIDYEHAEPVLTCASYDDQLFALSATDVLAPPDRYAMSVGRPARTELLKLQWGSPCLRAILSALGSRAPVDCDAARAVDLPRDLAKELKEFSIAEDGLLMKRISTTRVHNSRGSRLCYAVPMNSDDGKVYAQNLVSSYHSTSGCLGQRHLRWLVSRTFYLPGLRSLIASVCRTCPDCQFGSNRRYYSLLDSGRTLTMGVSAPWQTVSVDIADMVMDRTNKFSCALFLIDHYSSYCLVRPLPDMKAPTVSRTVESYIMMFGSMLTLRSDAGPCFRGRPFVAMLKKYGIRHKMTGPFAPFSNGAVERAISSIKFISRSLKNKRNWPQFLPRVLFRLNAKALNHVELSPFDIFFGRSLRLPLEVALENTGVAAEAHATPESEEARKETRDEIDHLVCAALRIRDDEVSTARGHLRRGPPAVGSTVLIYEPGVAGKGGTYDRQPYVVNDILDGTTLKLSKVGEPSSTKTSHYLNVRP